MFYWSQIWIYNNTVQGDPDNEMVQEVTILKSTCKWIVKSRFVTPFYVQNLEWK